MPNDSVQTLPINQLQPNPFQPRTNLLKEDLEELTESIKTFGILEPIVVAHTPAGYQIIAGERRWRAAKEAGLAEVPVFVKKTTPRGMLEMAIVENVQRVDLSALERAQAFQQLMRDFGFTTTQISEKVAKSASYVSNTLKLLDLPDAIKDGLVSGAISEGHARALSSIDNEKLMIECYKTILKENASVRRTEELVRRYKEEAAKGQTQTSERGRPIKADDDLIDEWKSKFQEHLHNKAQVKLVRSNRFTRLTISLKGSPEVTQEDLDQIMEKLTERSY